MTPIACTLTPDAYRRRIDDLGTLAARALRSRELTADGERLTFDRSAEIGESCAPPSRPRRAAARSCAWTSGAAVTRWSSTSQGRTTLDPSSRSCSCCSDGMPKPAREFFDAASIPWSPVAGQPGVSERVLARDDATGTVTRMLRWEPGLDTSAGGPVAHDHVEEVLLLTGSIRDLTLGETFRAGFYACRPPGMVHGPWVTIDGCEMLEITYRAR